jgi:hypothetical protein
MHDHPHFMTGTKSGMTFKLQSLHGDPRWQPFLEKMGLAT